MRSNHGWIQLAALLLCAAVALGAFGAHVLDSRFDAYQKSIYEKAVFYHFIHALGLLLVGVLGVTELLCQKSLNRIARLLTLGIILFSGSLYLLAFTYYKMWGAVTPFGGTAFLAAWLYLALVAAQGGRHSQKS